MPQATVLVSDGSTVLVQAGDEYQVWQPGSWGSTRRVGSAPATPAGWAAITETMALVAPSAELVDPPRRFRPRRLSSRAALAGVAALVVAGAVAGIIYATGSGHGRSSGGPGLSAVTGWVYSDNETVLMLTWNRNDAQVQGSLQVAQDTDGVIKADTAAYTGVINDDQVSLTIPTGFGTVTSLSAVITDQTLTLAVPDANGTIEQAVMHPGTASDYNTALDALRTRLSRQASASASASAVASSSTATAAIVDQTAGALARAVTDTRDYTTSTTTDLTSLAGQLTQIQTDLATTQHDAQTAINEAGSAPPGQACADAGTAGAEAGTVGADQGAVTATLAAAANDVTSLRNAVAAVSGARAAYKAEVQNSPGTAPSNTPPADSDIDAALTSAAGVLTEAGSAAATVPGQVQNYTQQAQAASDDASKRVC